MDKFFYHPLRPFILGQKFGENKACVDLATNSKVIACDGFNPPEGYRSVYGSNGHTGIDLGAFHGQEAYCAQRGYVDSIDTNPRTGLDVRIVSQIGLRKFRHIYEHLLGYQPTKGSWVETGQLVGWCNNTGYSSGDHLHFQLEEWLDGQWVPIDPLPLMADVFARDILAINNTIKFLFEQIARLADNLASFLRSR
mgnify:CR=1 FL=1